MSRITLTPLTAEEQQFAAEHHGILYKYLYSQKLPAEDWYDVLVFPYLQSVKKWFARPELQRYSFSTIAYNSMRSGVQRERQKQNRRIQPLSLDEQVAGTEDLTYMEIMTYEHLRYIPYETCGGNDMQIQYDVELPDLTKGHNRKKCEETLAIEVFLAENRKNICFKYGSKEEAKKKYNTIQTNKRRNGHQDYYEVRQKENCVYIIRLKELKRKGEK